jgi:MFS family permease
VSEEPATVGDAARAVRTDGKHRPRWLTRGIASVGLASFFSDWGHEIATAILPSFVTSTLRSSAGVLGLIEGISDGLIGIMKLVTGPVANDERRRLRLATGGYVVTAAATGAIGLAATVWQAGLLRAIAWMARGARSPARDAMLASLASPETYGRAFGVERAGDNLGAVVGPLTAAGLVAWIGIRPTLYLAALPGVFAAVAITVAAREARQHHEGVRRRARLELRGLRSAGLARPLVPVVLFELGNCAVTLLILRATTSLQQGGMAITQATTVAVLIYAAHNLFGSVVAYLGGHWLDRSTPRVVFASGGLLFGLSYALFALPLQSWPPLLLAFALAGSGVGLAETAESTLVAHLVPDHLRGSGFGMLGAVQSFGDFASSAAVGALWVAISPTAAFLYAAAWMAASIAASAFLRFRSNGGSQSPHES